MGRVASVTGQFVEPLGRVVRLGRIVRSRFGMPPRPGPGRRAEYGLLALLIAGVAVMAAVAQILQMPEAAKPTAWRPFFHHLFSALAILGFAPVIAGLDRHFPLRRDDWPATAAVHLGGSLVFAVAHIAWTLLAYRIGDALQGAGSEISLHNLAFIYMREAIIYALMLAFIRFAQGADRRGRNGAAPEDASLSRLRLVDGGAVRLVDPKDIDWISAAKNYVVVHAGDGEYVHRTTLKDLERALPKVGFFQINRSTIVRLENVRGLVSDGPRDQAVLLRCGAKLRVSRRRRLAMRERLINK